ncbi:MAG: InlB B-repeat-containing protein, partial [Actinomycetota bacterium]|nr:InlB B-repeat-containing protein [Actinomycetota bacterium]
EISGTIDSHDVKTGGLAVQPAEPIRDDYVFEGWYSDADLTTAFKFAESKIEADTTLYAKWSEAVYYLAGSFTGYEPKMAGYGMKPIAGKDGWYWLTVKLTEDLRDKTYDGHYYKVTNGTWAADGCWGTDSYALQPAPVSPTGGGLGSIWIENNCTLAVCFDSINKVIYDDSMVQTFATPRIYGDFNTAMDRGTDWSTADGEALELADADGDGIFTGLYEIPAYNGPNKDGYSMIVVISQKYYISEYGNAWGANEQYLFDGSAAGMNTASYLMPDKDTVYEFAYDSTTHVTTETPLEADQIKELAGPTVYGDFSSWLFEGGSSVVLKDDDGDGVYTGTLNLAAYTGTDKGYMIAIVLSKKLYNDEYGIRWGAEEQYLFDGSAAAMGSVSYLKPKKDTTYTLSYNSTTHVTTVTEK